MSKHELLVILFPFRKPFFRTLKKGDPLSEPCGPPKEGLYYRTL